MRAPDDLYESLSRYKSGDLSDSEARHLRERLATEPEVATSAAALEQLVSMLESLPEVAPPRDLDDLVLGRKPPAGRSFVIRRSKTLVAALIAAVAVCALSLSREPTPTDITVSYGEQIVSGRAVLLAGDATISLDGQARISVEPVEAPVREPPLENEDMKIILSSLGGAALGAIVTIAVTDGHAVVTTTDGVSTDLNKGEERVIRPIIHSQPVSSIAAGATDAQRVQALEAEIESLRQELAEAKFTGAVARGQVAQSQGEPSPWPVDVDPAYQPASFEANLRAEIEKIPGLTLHQLDCEEFPCVATLLGKDANGDLEKQIKALPESLQASYPNAGVWMGLAKMAGEDGVQSAAGLALMPNDGKPNDTVRTRTDFRAGSLLRDLESQLEGAHNE